MCGRLETGFEGAFEGFAEFEVVGDGDVADVALVGVVFDVFLVIVFGGVEGGEGFYLGHDLAGKFVSGGEGSDLVVDDLLFFGVAIEDHVAVLGADVISLAVEFGGVDAGEEGFDQCFEGDLCGVVEYFDGLGVAGGAGADFFVARIFGGAAGETGYGVANAGEALEDDLGVPEAAFREVGGLFVGSGGAGVFCGDIDGLGLAAGDEEEDGGESGQEVFHFNME